MDEELSCISLVKAALFDVSLNVGFFGLILVFTFSETIIKAILFFMSFIIFYLILELLVYFQNCDVISNIATVLGYLFVSLRSYNGVQQGSLIHVSYIDEIL